MELELDIKSKIGRNLKSNFIDVYNEMIINNGSELINIKSSNNIEEYKKDSAKILMSLMKEEYDKTHNIQYNKHDLKKRAKILIGKTLDMDKGKKDGFILYNLIYNERNDVIGAFEVAVCPFIFEFYILGITLTKDNRGRGVGSYVYSLMSRMCSSMGFYMALEYSEVYPESKNFWEKHGFSKRDGSKRDGSNGRSNPLYVNEKSMIHLGSLESSDNLLKSYLSKLIKKP